VNQISPLGGIPIDSVRSDFALVRNRSTVVRLAYPDFVNPALAKWLHRVDVPSLLIWGEQDGLVPPRFGEAYRAYLPNAQLVLIPRAAHAPFEEDPDAFLAAFDNFLASQSKSVFSRF
jgi:pimeloyl-ACP methyl ester carboxylesterase